MFVFSDLPQMKTTVVFACRGFILMARLVQTCSVRSCPGSHNLWLTDRHWLSEMNSRALYPPMPPLLLTAPLCRIVIMRYYSSDNNAWQTCWAFQLLSSSSADHYRKITPSVYKLTCRSQWWCSVAVFLLQTATNAEKRFSVHPSC